jgi:hypothetical protein
MRPLLVIVVANDAKSVATAVSSTMNIDVFRILQLCNKEDTAAGNAAPTRASAPTANSKLGRMNINPITVHD